ncbi:MAG: iron-containing alcohol dehydrogenase [Candidatus Lernaella stagnicola]|nr:iron-containing alcohol dehydrogenase [Candidatus Lernaella stagnicola]
MIPNYYEFHCPVKILSGHQALQNLPYEMGLLGVKKALLITDKGVVGAGLLKKVRAAIEGSQVKIGAVFDETPIDSDHHVVNKVAGIYRDKGCDCIIALGGGSAIDTAKGVNIVISTDTDDLMKFQGMDRIEAQMRPFIVIPTTAGTGSEVTQAAVIKDTDINIKRAFISDKLYPHLALLDPEMTLTMPARITAATGMDALTHSVEAFADLQKNPMSDAFATASVQLVFQYLTTAITKPDDKSARLAMANAALMGGISFSNAMVGIVHSIAHATGAVAHVPHGVANSILLPWGMEYNLAKSAGNYAELLHYMGVKDAPTRKRDRAKAAVQAVRDLQAKLHKLCGLPTTLSDAGVTQEQLPQIAHVAVNDGSLIHNPVEADEKDLLKVLKKAF